MNKENILRLKKYLFLISLFFVLVLGSHILYVYLYNDAVKTPVEGGSVSEGIIGEFPHLNPLLQSNDYNKNIIHNLYRSLLKYNFEEEKFEGDLANCDIKNLGYIECYLKDNIKWSNSSPITTQDVLSTFNVIKNSDINPLINSLLKETTIEERNGAIVFSNKVKDVNFLNVLMQPIVAKETLDNIGNKELNGKFNPTDGIYSGKYKVETISYDDTLGIQKLLLQKNEEYNGNDVLISKYIYRFFKDNSHFLKHKDTVNVFFDQNKIIGDSLVRLDKKPFYFNQYSAIFINQDRVTNDNLRSFLLGKIDVDNIIKSLGNGYKKVLNPYLSEDNSINKDIKNLNIEQIFKDLGYYKKGELASILIQEQENLNKPSENKKVNSDLKVINSPINKKYSFIGKDDILLKGNVAEIGVSEIFINGYKLSGYNAGSKEFYYRLKESFNNLKAGENKFTVEFNVNGTKKQVEEFYIIYSKDSEKLKRLEAEYFKEETQKTPIISQEEINKKTGSLEEKYYYNRNFEKFSIRFFYLDNQKEYAQVANIIKNTFDTYGIFTEIIPVSIQDLSTKITNGEKDYDMILTGIDLGYFDFNIFPYLHSSQVKNGYNLSNKKDLNLDIVLEELKSNIFDKEKTKELENKVLGVIGEKQILKTLYTKENILLIDKNIENFKLNEKIQSTIGVNEALYKAYVNSDKKIIFEEKSILDFLKFIKNIFKNEGESKK